MPSRRDAPHRQATASREELMRSLQAVIRLPSSIRLTRSTGWPSLVTMTNRKLDYIVKDQSPLTLPANETVQKACQLMWARVAGSTLVVDEQDRLIGIFTGRDAVRALAGAKDPIATQLRDVMTVNPITVTPKNTAIDALRAMCDGGFRHVPVTEDGKIRGVVSRGDFKGMEFEEFLWPKTRTSAGSARDRELAQIIENQAPLLLGEEETVQRACRSMVEQGAGSVLVVDSKQKLTGIFTGRNAVRLLSKAKDAGGTRLEEAMTPGPIAMSPKSSAIDALHAMNDGGFRHLPVIENGKVMGVVSRNDFTGIEIDRLDQEEHLRECLW